MEFYVHDTMTTMVFMCFSKYTCLYVVGVPTPILFSQVSKWVDVLTLMTYMQGDSAKHILNTLYRHLEGPQTHARILFADFSSAFNTIQTHILANKLCVMF